MEEIDGPRDRKLEPEKVGGNICEKEDTKVEDKLDQAQVAQEEINRDGQLFLNRLPIAWGHFPFKDGP